MNGTPALSATLSLGVSCLVGMHSKGGALIDRGALACACLIMRYWSEPNACVSVVEWVRVCMRVGAMT
jgi:hypothetical protein